MAKAANENLTEADKAFVSIYPDINPAEPLGSSIAERIGFACATAVLAFGGDMGDLIIAGAGLALVLFSVIGASMKTPRRVRNEARSRFPQQKWAEYSVNHTAWMLGCWIVITTVVALALFIVPEDQNAIGGVAAAVIAAVLIWVYPGFAPQKHKQKRNKKEEPEQEEAEVPDLTPHKQLDDDTQIFESVVPEKR
ncbi:hypothetical protein [Corynebacterium sp.]|uniref:hypothetical protein n=1 Tax=Corynebacterium sp. TaxID=1720 RepID=UPI0026498A93|nr:hypothetical protein [Corynebacterium sp.]MDN6136107.1 hypothetical protein [Corynebacterium sp.]MDN6737007.1 hypothetical protein [Corynebacterium sp.]